MLYNVTVKNLKGNIMNILIVLTSHDKLGETGLKTGAYADHIRTASRLTSGHSAEVDSYTLPIYIRTI